MSTGRLTFTVKALEDAAARKRDARIAEAELKYAERMDLGGRRNKWRADAEAMIRNLNRGLKDRADVELSGFCIPSMPTADRYSRAEDERDGKIAEAHKSFEWTMRRIVSLAPPEKGELSLTPAQLKEFFAL